METGQIISLAWDSILKIVGLSGVVSAVVAWLVVRFTKPLDSYTEELARQLARHQNLDKLIEETRRLTDATETIKAALSHENWDRQQRWSRKNEMYVEIVQKVYQ